MPSLSKMPSAARNFVSNMFSFLHGSPSPQPGLSEKSVKQFSTPQADRKNKVNVLRRMSDTHTMNGQSNGMGKRIKVKNVERWEPNIYEKELLRRTWSDEFDFLYDLGSAIYTYIFENNPNCKQLFPYLEKYGDKWKDSKEFRGQALKFVQTLSQVVKNLYHMDRLEPYLYGIGQRHCKFTDRGFKPEYWDIFQDAMEHSLTEHMNSLHDLDATQRIDAVTANFFLIVWRTLALYVTAHMRAGYQDGLKAINKHPPLV
uniref:GLOBIN domain-containing protein n=1 Tax=Heterorhabditis bacteriophora TaxID=37862 RepID=A0A1I7XFU7_HETBA